MLKITSYVIQHNSHYDTPGKFHIAAVCGDLLEDEQLARRRGGFATRKQAAEALARIKAENHAAGY